MINIKKSSKLVGYLCGIGAAVCYGTNPLGALNLYAEGLSTNTVLLYRFGFGAIIVAIIMLIRHETFRVSLHDLGVLLGLGALFMVSSLSLYLSFRYMDAGVASTLLFTYPIMTAILMAVLFHERITWSTVLAIGLSLLGVGLLYWNGDGGTLNGFGVALVLVSALTYAVYIIIQNRTRMQLSPFQISFYVLLTCALFNLICEILSDDPLRFPPTPRAWFYALWLAVVPTIFALVLLTCAAKRIGSTPTSIMGALEPLTAVMISVFVFHEAFTSQLAIGIALILAAVIIIVLRKEPST